MMIYAVAGYLIYLLIFVFLIRGQYSIGLYLFTPIMLYSLFRLLSIPVSRQMIMLVVYTSIPFVISVFLTINEKYSGWEITGLLPVAVIGSFVLRGDKKTTTPLVTSMIDNKVFYFLLLVFLFAGINYYRNMNINPEAHFNSLYLLVSIYSPAILFTTMVIFLLFIIETATVRSVLNNYRLFIDGGKIERIIFNTTDFLEISQFNITDIVTAEGVPQNDFVNKIELLNNAVAAKNDKGEQAIFTHSFDDGMTLTMAPLCVLLDRKEYSAGRVELPKNPSNRAYAALAENNEIIGYYLINRQDMASNNILLKLLREKFGVFSVIVTQKKDKKWTENSQVVTSLDKLELKETDLILTDVPVDGGRAYVAGWGKADQENCDLYLVEPFLMNILKLIITCRRLPARLNLAILLASIPFLIPLFASIYLVYLPQLSGIAVLFSVLVSVAMMLYRGKAIPV